MAALSAGPSQSGPVSRRTQRSGRSREKVNPCLAQRAPTSASRRTRCSPAPALSPRAHSRRLGPRRRYRARTIARCRTRCASSTAPLALGAGFFPAPDYPPWVAFKEGFRDLGYVEGQSLLLEARFAGGDANRLPALAREL